MLLHGAMASGKLAYKRNVPEPIPQISVGLSFRMSVCKNSRM